tara:strand:- start:2014 stop:4701 length:2688 start_codon:yes stop_codon:yes gene_type:complete
MAVNLGSMNITLGLDLSKFEKQLKGVRRRFGRLSGQLKMAGRDLTAAISAPLIGVGLLATKTAIDWETSFAKVQKTVKGTDVELAELAKGLRDMSLRLPVAAGGLASIAEEAGRLGIERGNILKFTETIVNLAETSTMVAEEAAVALARFKAITKLSGEDINRLATSLTILGSEFETTESEVMEMSLRIAAMGKIIGLSEADILGLSAAMTSVGIAAEMGGTAMSKVLMGIAEAAGEGGKKLTTMAAIAGMTADTFSQKFEKDAAGAVNALIKGLGKLEKEEAFKAVKMMGFSADRTARMLFTLGQAGDKLTKTLRRSSEAWQDEDALQKLARKRYDTTGAQLTVLKNRFVEMTRVLGEALIPAVIALLEVIRDRFLPIIQGWIEAFAATTPAMKATIITVTALAAAIGPLLIVVGALAGSIAGLASVLTLVAAHPVVALIAGIAALVMAVVGYNYVADKMKSITSGIGGEMDDTEKSIKAYESQIKQLTRIEEVRAKLEEAELARKKELAAWEKKPAFSILTQKPIYGAVYEGLLITIKELKKELGLVKLKLSGVNDSKLGLLDTTKGLTKAEAEWEIQNLKTLQALDESEKNTENLRKAYGAVGREVELFNGLMAEETVLHKKLIQIAKDDPTELTADAMDKSNERYADFKELLAACVGEGGNFAKMLADIKAKADAANETAKESISSWQAWKEGMAKIIAGTSQLLDDFKTNTMTSFTNGIGDAFAAVLVSGESFKDQLKNLWKSLAAAVISQLVSMGAQLIIFSALQKTILATGAATVVKAKAGETFAATFASVISAVPFPLNIVLAPIVAAAQVAAMIGGVPAMAEGGIISQPQLVLAGEAGPEAIVPLDRMGEFGGGGQTINLHVDGELIAQEAVKGMPAFIDARLGGI